MTETENIMSDYIEKVCEILEIEIPNVSYDTSNFSSDTMLAQVCPEEYTLYLKKLEKVNFDGLFILAHELRHLWQYKYNFELLEKYQSREKYSSIDEYNLQPAEIDANAFGGVVMVTFFKRKPTFDSLSETVKNKIYEKMEEWK